MFFRVTLNNGTTVTYENSSANINNVSELITFMNDMFLNNPGANEVQVQQGTNADRVQILSLDTVNLSDLVSAQLLNTSNVVFMNVDIERNKDCTQLP